MSNPPLIEVNLGNNSPNVYTIPSPSYTASPFSQPLYSKNQWPTNHAGVCYDPSHYNQSSCHTNLPPDTPYVIRTLPCDPVCGPDPVQRRRRQVGVIICGCCVIALPVIIFFVVLSFVLTRM